MKKKRVIIWSVITLLTIIAVLEVFDLHPSIRFGQYDVRWSGIRHMGFTAGDASVSSPDINAKFRVYEFGPFMVLKSV